MPTCGNCKQQGQTIAHIKGCYQVVASAKPSAPVVLASDFTPMATSTVVAHADVPASKYALVQDGKIVFYEVRIGKKGKWAGFTFLDHLVGHPGDFMHYPVKGIMRGNIMNLIAADPKSAAVMFSKHFTVCAVCSSPLSDPESLARGLGPICADRF